MKRRGWRRWVWGLDAASVVLVVAIGVATNQILNNGEWAWWWLVGDLVLAGAAAAVTHKIAAIRTDAKDKTGQLLPWPALTRLDGQPKTFTEVTPRDLGVHPNRFGAEGEALYIARDVDETLGTAITDGDRRVVIVQGPRLSGATSTFAQAAQSQLPRHRVIGFIDDPRVRLTDMIDYARPWAEQRPGAVLWLDGLTPDRFAELATMSHDRLPEGLQVLATFNIGELDGLRIPEYQVKALEERAVRVTLGVLSDAERTELAAQEIYAELRPALEDGTDVLMGRLMVAWDQICTALTRAEEGSTDRIALLRAITDWNRAQLPRLLSKDILDHLYKAYRRELAGQNIDAPVSTTAYARALRWATKPDQSRPQLIDIRAVTDGQCYVPHPLLTAIADDLAEVVHWPVHDALWHYANLHFDGDQRRDIGYTALRLGAYAAAHHLLDHPDATPEPPALYQVGCWLHSVGDIEGARHWYQRTTTTDHPDAAPQAMLKLGILERDENQLEQAQQWYREAVDTGHSDAAPQAMLELGAMANRVDDFTQARHWYELAAATGHTKAAPTAMVGMGFVERNSGRVKHARRWWKKAVASQSDDATPTAMICLGALEYQVGQVAQARSWYERAAAADPPTETTLRAMAGRARLEFDLQRLDQTRHWLDKAERCYDGLTTNGDVGGSKKEMFDLGVLEYEMGRLEQARYWWKETVANAPAAVPEAMYNLGLLEHSHGSLEQARHWYEQVIATGDSPNTPQAMHNLGTLENQTGRVERAQYLWRQAATSGHADAAPRAMVSLGNHEQGMGRVEKALRWYERAAATDHPEASTARSKLRQLQQRKHE